MPLPPADYIGGVKFLLVFLVLAVTIYLVVRLLERRGGRGGSNGARLRPPPRPNRPIGPDDDPDFLRDLNRRRRHKEE